MSATSSLMKWIAPVVLLAGCRHEIETVVNPDAPPADRTASWPRFHGPNGDNISTETGLLKRWPAEGPIRAWRVSGIGDGYAGVTIDDGLIYTAGNVGGRTTITALDLDGGKCWQVPNGKAWTGNYPGTRGTPTIDGGRVYHESPLGEVVCLDARTGDEIWRINILDRFRGKNPEWALAESVSIDGNHVICCPGGPNTAVVALDKETGETVWQSESADGDLPGYNSPVLVEHEGLRIILTMTDKALIGVGADTGRLLFRYPHRTRYDIHATDPIYHDGHVFISSGYGTTGSEMLRIDAAGDRVSMEKVWGSRDLDNHHGGVILLDGYLYGAAYGPRWICLDWETGATMYAEEGVGKGSATCAEGMLYVINEEGTVGLVKATPDGHDVISLFQLPDDSDAKTWAHPVVCGGRLYLRRGEYLYAYDVRAE
ncbi:MAG TPA: PQQ-binding-like beta-propeller repeat protein [Thermoguttaceae bacterium]|nr:PQQ-binding-like beta-propeller repeat protein [Thermoguttaceae bacterium]